MINEKEFVAAWLPFQNDVSGFGALARRVIASVKPDPVATEPKDATPNRLNTWWQVTEFPQRIMRVIRRGTAKTGKWAGGWECDGPLGLCWVSDNEINECWQQIPPRPDAKPGKQFRQCRVPKAGERIAHGNGQVYPTTVDYAELDLRHDPFGGRRWIEEPTPADLDCIDCDNNGNDAMCQGCDRNFSLHSSLRDTPAEQPKPADVRWVQIGHETWDLRRGDLPILCASMYSTDADRAKILAAFDPDRVSIAVAEHAAFKELEEHARAYCGFTARILQLEAARRAK